MWELSEKEEEEIKSKENKHTMEKLMNHLKTISRKFAAKHFYNVYGKFILFSKNNFTGQIQAQLQMT